MILISLFLVGSLGKLLVITPDDFYNNIQSLVQWKREKGYFVEVARLSEIGSTAPQIKSYIQSRYDSSGLKYCLLVGAINKIPSFDLPGPPSGVTDYLYGCFDDDLFQEVIISRLPASSVAELDCIVAKILSYEKDPYLGDTLWFKRALAVATSYVGGSGTPALTALETKRWLAGLLMSKGYERVDTIFHPPNLTGESIAAVVNRGVLYVNGRGWGNSDGWEYPRFDRNDVSNLTNGYRLPVITSFYCATGNFNRNPCFGEVWLRAGTPSLPKGGVLFFGPSYTTTSTRWNNFLDAAVYSAIFEKGLTTAGDVFLDAKIEMSKNFPLPSDSLDLRIHIQTYNILGDPTLSFWRGCPKRFSCQYPTSLAVGSQRVLVSVPGVESCLVSFYKESDCSGISYTDRYGNAYVDLCPREEGNITLTVTKRDYLPYQVTLPVVLSPVHCGFAGYEISAPNPGERILYLDVKNYGRESARDVSGKIRSESEKVRVLDSVAFFGDIEPGTSVRSGPLRVEISPTALDKESLSFSLYLLERSRTFNSGFKLEVRWSDFSFVGVRVDDGNNQILEPGEEANLYVRIKNIGRVGRSAVASSLRLLSSAGILIDTAGFYGEMAPSEEKENLDPFRIRLSPEFSSNRALHFQILLHEAGEVCQRINFSIQPGPYEAKRPLGPSLYGYYAYDDIDTIVPQRPVYSWVEIDPRFGGMGTRLSLGDDGIRSLPLPFTFTHFGREYNTISISANGYAVLGTSNYKSPYNWNIPSPFSPSNLLAVFWDDLHPDTGSSSGVYYWGDTSNHRFIIQWSRVHHVHGFRNPNLGELQTFQLILFDPEYYPTRTGDGEIIMQYYFCQNDDSLSGNCHNYATVGITGESDGLLFTYANQYPGGAFVLGPERAIKWTTNPPDTFSGLLLPKGPLNKREISYPTIMKKRDLLAISSQSQLRIYDCLGRLLFSEREAKAEMRRLGTGIYFIGTGEGIRKFIVLK